MARNRWALTAGRVVTYDGRIVFSIDGFRDTRGIRYHPAELDSLAAVIVDALNRHRPAINGAAVLREG